MAVGPVIVPGLDNVVTTFTAIDLLLLPHPLMALTTMLPLDELVVVLKVVPVAPEEMLQPVGTDQL